MERLEISIVVTILIAALFVVRNLRPRPMRASRLWIAPAFLVLVTLLGVAGSVAGHAPAPLVALWVLGGAALGTPFGLLRGRHTRLRPTSHPGVMIVEPAIVPLLIWLGAFVVRFALRTVMPNTGSFALAASDGFLAFAVSSVIASRFVLATRFKELTAGA